LCIVLDHNCSDTEQNIDLERIIAHSEFLDQLRGFLADEETNWSAAWIHLLLNKQDLWKNAPDQERERLLNLFRREVERWEDGNWAQRVTATRYSNKYNDDVAEFIQKIVAFIGEHDN